MDFSGVFYIDLSSPSGLRWKIDRYKGLQYAQLHRSAGSIAGTFNGCGYYQVNIDNKTYLAHRIVYSIANNLPLEEFGGKVIDHLDQDRTNNDPSNLRLVSNSINQRNKKLSKNSPYGVDGVRPMHIKASNNTYFTANWRDSSGVGKSKTFSLSKFGVMEAFKMAALYRKKMITELNNNGAGYTEIHGK
jgi:hypothetical protein